MFRFDLSKRFCNDIKLNKMKTLKEISKLVDLEIEKLSITEMLKINLLEYRDELTKQFILKQEDETKTYYYSLWENAVWKENTQYEMGELDYPTAAMLVQVIAESMKTTVRLCDSKGYDNQGYYFAPKFNFKN